MNEVTALLILSACLLWLSGAIPLEFTETYLYVSALVLYVVIRFYKSSSWAVGLTILICSFEFSITFSDFALRYILKDRLYSRAHDRLFERSPNYEESYRYSPNSYVKQNVIGDLANMSCFSLMKEAREEIFATDSFGFRNDPELCGTAPIDLLVLGDSFGVGLGTTQADTWWAKLAKSTNRQLCNLSLPSAPKEEALVLKRELPRLNLAKDATVIWMLFEGNDLDDETSVEEGLIPKKADLRLNFATRINNFQRRSPIRLLTSSLFPECLERHKVEEKVIPNFGKAIFYKKYDATNFLSEEGVQSRQGWKNIKVAFSEIAEMRDQKKFDVLVVVVPAKEQVYRPPEIDYKASTLARLLREESLRYAFDFLDLGVPLREQADMITSGEMFYWRDDTHWNALGNDRVAKLVQSKLGM